MPPAASNTWSVTVQNTFTETGTFHYYCDVHGGPGGLGMSGTVVVDPASPGGGAGTPPTSGGPVANVAPPVASLSGPVKQRIAKLYVRASMSAAGTLAATGTVGLPGAAKVYRFKQAKRTVSANQLVKRRLKLSTLAL